MEPQYLFKESHRALSSKLTAVLAILTIVLFAAIIIVLDSLDVLSDMLKMVLIVAGLGIAAVIVLIYFKLRYTVIVGDDFFSVAAGTGPMKLRTDFIRGFEIESLVDVDGGMLGMKYSTDRMVMKFPGTTMAVRIYTEASSLAIGTMRPEEFVAALSAVTGLKPGQP